MSLTFVVVAVYFILFCFCILFFHCFLSVVRSFAVQFVGFLCSGFRSPLSSLLCFITLVLMIYVSL